MGHRYEASARKPKNLPIQYCEQQTISQLRQTLYCTFYYTEVCCNLTLSKRTIIHDQCSYCVNCYILQPFEIFYHCRCASVLGQNQNCVITIVCTTYVFKLIYESFGMKFCKVSIQCYKLIMIELEETSEVSIGSLLKGTLY